MTGSERERERERERLKESVKEREGVREVTERERGSEREVTERERGSEREGLKERERETLPALWILSPLFAFPVLSKKRIHVITTSVNSNINSKTVTQI